MSQQKPFNIGSKLLSNAENEHLFHLVGERCVTLATAVVQLFSADPPERNTWNFRCCGVACFVKDYSMRTYFIRLYDILNDQLIFEQELYNGFYYKEVRPYLHTFEADEYQTALNFSEDLSEEAFEFKKAIDEKLAARDRLKAEKNNLKQAQKDNNQPRREIRPVNPESVPHGNGHKENKSKIPKRKDNDKRPRIKKKDIGSPTDFQHVSHLGYNNQPAEQLNVQTLDPDMKAIFTGLGYEETQSVSEDDYQFVTQYVSEKGGVGEFKKQLGEKQYLKPQTTTANQTNTETEQENWNAKKSRPPPLPKTGPVSTQQNKQNKRKVTGNRSLAQGTPPPPPRVTPSSSQNIPPSHIDTPPPPPMSPPLPGSKSSPMQCVQTPPPAPPAPPPPSSVNSLNQSAPAPPPVPLSPPNAPLATQSSGRGALLEQIRQGGKPLRKVDNNVNRGTGNSRGDLLSAIRSGTTLRHVKQVKDEEKRASLTEDGEGVMGALAKALADRQKHIQLSDEEKEDDEDDDFVDDDWDD